MVRGKWPSARDWMMDGYGFFSRGEYERAVECYDKALAIDVLAINDKHEEAQLQKNMHLFNWKKLNCRKSSKSKK